MWVIEPDGTLRFRSVEIVRSERDRVLISAGVREGDRVCVSALDAATDGMKVRVYDDDAASGARAREDAA